MQIVVKIPDDKLAADVHFFWEENRDNQLTEEEKALRQNALDTLCRLGSLGKFGYRSFGGNPLISIKKKDGHLYIEIDEKEVEIVEKRG